MGRRVVAAVAAWLAVLLFAVPILLAQSSPQNPPAISGSGKTDFIPIWANSTTLSSSTLFEQSGKVGIGTQTPAATLEVNGTAKFDEAITFASGQTFPGTATLSGPNTFTGTQTIGSGNLSISSGDLDLPETTDAAIGVINLGGSPFVHACCPNSTLNTFVGTNAGNFTADASSSGGLGANTAVGYQALLSLTSGSANTASGAFALYSNTSGLDNTAIGENALFANTTGGVNAAVGEGALSRNTSGGGNTAMGTVALDANTTGSDNTASGLEALRFNTTGNYNSALGYTALYQNTTGSENTASGSALGSNTTGNYNSALGYAANVGSGNLNNATAVGACTIVSASNALVLGAPNGACGGGLPSANTNVGVDVGSPSNILTVLQGGGPAIADGWSTYSSRRWKSNIRPLQGALGKVERLQGVEYTYTANGKHDIGMIAEEVGKVVPEVVSYEENGKNARGIDYARLTALLVEAVKQQQAEIRHQQAEIKQLSSEVRALENKK